MSNQPQYSVLWRVPEAEVMPTSVARRIPGRPGTSRTWYHRSASLAGTRARVRPFPRRPRLGRRGRQTSHRTGAALTSPPVTLASLEFRWADIYLVCYARGKWVALRRDHLRFLTADTLAGVERAIESDHRDHPVPRDFGPPGAADYLGFPDEDLPDDASRFILAALRHAFPTWIITYWWAAAQSQGSDGGEVFLAHMHHEGCGQVVGPGQRRGGRWTRHLPAKASFADEPGDHRGERSELSCPVRVCGLVDGGVQMQRCGRLARVGAGVEAGKQGRESSTSRMARMLAPSRSPSRRGRLSASSDREMSSA
jgi:hypothetical protein